MNLPDLKIPDLRNMFATIVADLRARRLLPAVGVIAVALIAIPLLLSQSASTRTPNLPTLPAIKIGTAHPVVGHVQHSSPATNYLTGPAHDPFKAPPATNVTAKGSGTPKASETTGTRGTTDTSTKTASAHTGTTSGSKSVKVATKSPAKVYVSYRPQLLFGTADHPLRSSDDLPRYAALGPKDQAVLFYLGLEKNARTVVFLVPNGTTVSGTGECSPKPSSCRYLAIRPGDNVTLTTQAGSQYALRYRSVHKLTSHHPFKVGASAYGQALISWAAGFMAPLKSLSYAVGTGLLTIHLGSSAPALQIHEITTTMSATSTTG
jgi:hypothetical protein